MYQGPGWLSYKRVHPNLMSACHTPCIIMKTTPCLSRAALSAAAVLCLSSLPAMGAVVWVDEILARPSTQTGTDAAITDQSNNTGWEGITLSGVAPTLTLGWSNAFTNDGTGVIKIASTLRLFPDPTGSGYDIRFLLEDDSYSDTYTVSASSAVKVLDITAKKYVARQTILIDDVYNGPLAVKGIEFTNLNPETADGVTTHDPLSILSVSAEIPPEPDDQAPEPASAMLAAIGAITLAGRRRRR